MCLHERHTITEQSGFGEIRRRVKRLAEELGFPPEAREKAAIVANELGSNLVKHAGGGGEILVGKYLCRDIPGIELLSIDRGPGIRNMAQALVDGVSTTGSRGEGLGAVKRLSHEFDIHSGPGKGAVVLARIPREKPDAHLPVESPMVAGVMLPYPGEQVCGDDWAAHTTTNGTVILVADGLGHGKEAHEASSLAVRVFRKQPDLPPKEMLQGLHLALRGTRGAAIAVAFLDRRKRRVRYAGCGNISGRIFGKERSSGCVSRNGIVGHQMRSPVEFEYEWPKDAVVVVSSDGLSTHWILEKDPLAQRHPAVIAAALYRDYRRGNDDATVVVAKEPGPETP
jgi:anti-sigma regulatory factor (Ser/Thr protein kinase)